jgi:hypothetical protein
LWMLPVAFVVTAAPLARAVRAGQNILRSPAALCLRLVLLAAVAMWGGLISDQLPCFMGAPNCD